MAGPRAILTDIEGTTSSIAFVHDVLFPYSRARLAGFVRAHADRLSDILDATRHEAGDAELALEDCIALLTQWHDDDRKIGPLKAVQALIWEEGFHTGAFSGHVYADAATALRRWQAEGIALYVYSSGSISAQKLLFGYSDFGDLTPLFAGHFDTAVGSKRDAQSYRLIAQAIGLDPAAILFLSDVAEELEAAEMAGLDVILVVRDAKSVDGRFPIVRTFEDIDKLLAAT